MLVDALAAADQLKDTLEREVHQAQGERALLRRMDARAILGRASDRQAFNSKLQSLQEELTRTLTRAAESWGTDQITWPIAQQNDPDCAGRLKEVIEQVASLASALRELDLLHRTLVERTLSCLRAYSQRMNPKVAAYDRRGARTSRSDIGGGAWGHV